MKPIFLTSVLLFLLLSAGNAQTKKTKRPALFSFNLSFSDYSFPRLIKDSSISTALKDEAWYKTADKSVGIGASWWKPLSGTVFFSANFTGTFSNFPANFVKDDSIGQAGFTPQLNTLLHLNMFRPNVVINPFLSAGAGIGSFGKQLAAYAPLGVGLKIRFNEGAYLINQIQWRKQLTDGINDDYIYYSFSFAQAPAKKKEPKPAAEPTAVIPPDKDGDGFEDSKDECIDVKGTVKGCPDADGDGIADKNDNCPNDKGTLNGCPDSDGDGIADKDDACKDAVGLLRYKGCPVPDTDKDGINDEEDKCPKEAGTPDNNGCPQLKKEVKEKVDYAAKNIFFKFASDQLLDVSLKALYEVATIMVEHPDLKLNIAAHADNRGLPERNMMWSERRAKAVADYFTKKGINPERITYKGYGDSQPIADNKTEAGRSKNRRVEMKLDY